MCYNETMNRIKEFMDERHMSQAELARQLGISEGMVSLLIHGKREVSDAMRWRWQETFGARVVVNYLNGDDTEATE